MSETFSTPSRSLISLASASFFLEIFEGDYLSNALPEYAELCFLMSCCCCWLPSAGFYFLCFLLLSLASLEFGSLWISRSVFSSMTGISLEYPLPPLLLELDTCYSLMSFWEVERTAAATSPLIYSLLLLGLLTLIPLALRDITILSLLRDTFCVPFCY